MYKRRKSLKNKKSKNRHKSSMRGGTKKYVSPKLLALIQRPELGNILQFHLSEELKFYPLNNVNDSFGDMLAARKAFADSIKRTTESIVNFNTTYEDLYNTYRKLQTENALPEVLQDIESTLHTYSQLNDQIVQEYVYGKNSIKNLKTNINNNLTNLQQHLR